MNSEVQRNTQPLDLGQTLSGLPPLGFDINDWGLLQVQGPDAEKFLQGQASCDLGQLAERGHLSGALCNPKGRVLATFRLFAVDDSIYLRMPRDLIKHIQSHLQRYSVFFEVKLHYAHELVGLGLLGAQQHDSEVADPGFPVSLDQGNLVEFWGSPENILELRAGIANQFSIASPDWWEAYLIKSGEAQIFALTSEHFVAHQLSLDLSGAISFSKGCYTGQEIIARTQYRGKSKKRLAVAHLQHREDFYPGTEIISEINEALGHLLLSISDSGTTLIQAVLPDDLPPRGHFVLGNHKTAYELIELPYQNQ